LLQGYRDQCLPMRIHRLVPSTLARDQVGY
jgi:hypothetical protein